MSAAPRELRVRGRVVLTRSIIACVLTRGPDQHPFAETTEDGQHLRRPFTGRAEPVRYLRVELRRFTRAEDQVPVAEDEPHAPGEDVEPLEPAVVPLEGDTLNLCLGPGRRWCLAGLCNTPCVTSRTTLRSVIPRISAASAPLRPSTGRLASGRPRG